MPSLLSQAWRAFMAKRASKPFYRLMQKVSHDGRCCPSWEPICDGFDPGCTVATRIWLSTDLHDLAQPVARRELDRVDHRHELVEHGDGLGHIAVLAHVRGHGSLFLLEGVTLDEEDATALGLNPPRDLTGSQRERQMPFGHVP